MSGSQPQGQRSGEGTSGLWDLVRDDDERKEKRPDGRWDEDARRQYKRDDGQQQQQQPQGQR